ncbi:MAG: TonB-dependent receptor [Bacteroidia bacterium]
MQKLLITFFLSSIFGLTFAHKGMISGKLIEESSRLPIEFAYIELNENQHCISGNDGRFIFENLEQGEYTLSIQLIGYEKKEVKTTVKEHEATELIITLKPKNVELNEVVISSDKNQTIHSISKMDIALRPVNSAQELLRMASGVFIAQHAGGGKAEQIFLRGFDCDHGTDIALSVDGLPVNMVSHAHGQGYADLHFVIPEMVEKIAIDKGCYDASVGNFATAGAIAFQTQNYLDKNKISLEVGRFNHYRLFSAINLLGKKARENQQNWYVAGEYLFRQGFFQNPDNLNRLNFFTKYQGMIDDRNILTASFSHFKSFWNASGQIPESEVRNGNLNYFGSIDNSEGGKTGRTNANIQVLSTLSDHQYFKNQLFFSHYDFDLFSNFTFFLHDKVNGDGIRQREDRKIYGYKGEFHQKNTWRKLQFDTEIGANIRLDDIQNNELSRVKRRNIFLNPISLGDVQELNAAIYVNENVQISPKFSANVGMRLDAFVFNYNDKLDSTGYQVRNVKKLTPSPKMSLYYQASPKMLYFVKAGIGFHSNDTRVVVAQNGLQILPKATGAEIGAEMKPFRNVFLHAALWGLYLQQEFVYVGDEAVVEPSGETRRVGIDVSARWQITPWLSADCDINYSNARALNAEVISEKYIPLAPRFTSIGGVKAKVAKNFLVNVRYRYLANRPANEDYSLTAKGYFLADATLTYQVKQLEISLFTENITNVKWKEAQFETESQLQNASEPITQVHFTAGTPFSAKMKVTYSF